MSSRCFLIEPMRKNADNASLLKPFGPIYYVFGENESRPSIYDSDRFTEEVIQRLNNAKFNPTKDYVVLSGSVNTNAYLIAVVSYWFAINCKLRTLMYQPDDRKFVFVEI